MNLFTFHSIIINFRVEFKEFDEKENNEVLIKIAFSFQLEKFTSRGINNLIIS